MTNFSIDPIVPTREIHEARKRFGQNFLIDTNIIMRLVASVAAKPQQNLIEIGPGLGALTRPLLNDAKNMTVIELDRDLLPYLQSLQGLNVINQDVLTVDFSTLATSESRLRIIGNLPYNISTPILFHLLQYYPLIQDMHFMLQKEVVERMAATPNSKIYGRLSVMLQRYCEIIPLILIPPESFKPAPKVMSQFVRLVPYSSPKYHILDDVCFEKIVRIAFSMRRKTLRNTLKGLVNDAGFEACGIEPTARAETLSVQEFVNLANWFVENK